MILRSLGFALLLLGADAHAQAPHWSFVPPTRPEVPTSGAGWAKADLDRFLALRWQAQGLEHAPEADRRSLVRRVSFDLRGLPPSLAEIEAFERDRSEHAYEAMVDRMLADPAYGERWATPWLDLARYADSRGFEKDQGRTIWPWRDWVVEALNADMPFDRFSILQLAGDLLPDADDHALLATAFHRNTMTNDEGGTDDEEFRTLAVKDRVETTFQVWMGLTMNCARCHAHKYDPISTEDYYGVYAIFNQTEDADRSDDSPWIHVLPAGSDRTRESYTEDELKALPRVPILRERKVDQRRANRIHRRGNFLDQTEEVAAALPKAFHASSANDEVIDRLYLARWLVSAANPLTARVYANRLWARIFGRGIVETEEDFGTKGALPTHPELLDWLATEVLRLEWSQKAFLRLLLCSAAYRQSSDASANDHARDRFNRFLARGPRTRLSAEMLRDQALAVSGLLSSKRGGAPVFPPQPPGIWQVVYDARDWTTSTGEDRYRRALYTYWRRSSPYPSYQTLDAPSRDLCAPRRFLTITPLQALTLWNDPVFIEAAQALARRVLREAEARRSSRLMLAFELATARTPRTEELQTLELLYEERLVAWQSDDAAARAFACDPLGPVEGDAIAMPELAALVACCSVILNSEACWVKR